MDGGGFHSRNPQAKVSSDGGGGGGGGKPPRMRGYDEIPRR